jgi:transposase
MPRTCLACASPDRAAIDKALIAGEPFRNIAKRVSISPAGLLRHKNHVAKAIVKASEKREETLSDNLLDEMRRVQRKAWDLLSKTESEGDHRGSIVALREVRECLESLGAMLANARGGDQPQEIKYDFTALSDEELWALEALLAKAGVSEVSGSYGAREPYKTRTAET